MRLFGTSGIRREVSHDLVNLALQVCIATGKLYQNVVIGRDTRTSGNALKNAVTAGLLAAGASCNDAGVLPTPTLAYLAREYSAGIMITASHNPPQYNGLKMLNPDGSAFSPQQQKEIENMLENRSAMEVSWEKMQSGGEDRTGIEKHITRILNDFNNLSGIKVAVDTGCCAAYFISPEMLRRAGCEVITLNDYPCGVFPHDVEPVEANLAELIKTVKEKRVDLGIAHDGDADRMMAVDDLGRFISGDKMLAILGRFFSSKKIVTTIDASMVLEEMDLDIERTPVGDPYVSEQLKSGGGQFGGEPSGAWVFPGISYCPDGIYAAATIAAIASREKLSAIVDDIPEYPVKRGNVKGTVPCIEELYKKMEEKFSSGSIITIDGLKIVLQDGWILVRPSGTEPRIRLTVEARNNQTAEEYYRESHAIIEQYTKGTG